MIFGVQVGFIPAAVGGADKVVIESQLRSAAARVARAHRRLGKELTAEARAVIQGVNARAAASAAALPDAGPAHVLQIAQHFRRDDFDDALEAVKFAAALAIRTAPPRALSLRARTIQRSSYRITGLIKTELGLAAELTRMRPEAQPSAEMLVNLPAIERSVPPEVMDEIAELVNAEYIVGSHEPPSSRTVVFNGPVRVRSSALRALPPDSPVFYLTQQDGWYMRTVRDFFPP